MSNLLFYPAIALISFAIQLVILFATGKRFRPLRFALPVLAVAVSVIVILLFAFTNLKGSEGIMLLFNIFGFLLLIGFCLFVAAPVLIGWGLAWAVYYLVKRK